MKNLIKQIILEKVTKTKVICDNCGWSWKIKDGGKDPYVCHNILKSGRMCNHDNTPKKKLNEDLQSNVIFLPYSDDYNEDLEEYNIDEYDLGTQTLNIAKQNNLNILSDKNLKGFLFDTTNNQIVGALWTSDDNNSFSFDIAIDKQYQGLKLSHLLIKNAIEEYNTQSDYGNFNLPMKVDVINPMLANILKTKYNFRVVKRISNDRVIMAIKKNLKEEENILNEKCWKGYTQKGMKTMFGKQYPNCVKKLKEQEDYKGEHTAPSKDQGYSSMNDLYNAYGDDIYTNNAVRYYGDGYPYDNLAIAIMQSARNKPNKLIKIYRAIPDFNKEVKEKINELLKLNQYYDKFNFFPMNNNIIENIKDKYPLENYSYNEQTKLILSDIFKKVNELKNQLENNKITINNGDWVTTTLQYAKGHGQSVLNNKYKIISKTVPASTLYTDGNSIHEFGYNA
jgi:hypothetical protein